jgi:hypothetical protein
VIKGYANGLDAEKLAPGLKKIRVGLSKIHLAEEVERIGGKS